ncbi:MAG: hypothetical protein GX561_03440 [Lentisphaerae bacterium]|jgi:alpha-galactosidase|nr:hypothetical protein [Lentisphaerota bacterium]
MSIHVQDNIFLIQTQRMSYAFGIGAGGKLIHLYWGDKLPNANGLQRLLQQTQKTMFSNYELPLEYRGQEPFDYFQPAILPVFSDQGRGARLAVTNHKLDDNSLTVTLKDINYPLEADLVYQTFGQLDLIARHAVIRNTGTDDITLEILKSATLNLPTPANHYRVTHYAGNWGAEFGQQQCKLTQAQIVLENHRGTCAAHQHIPFVALDPESQATETTGQVFFAALKWSGDFKITVEQEFKGSVSIAAGINDFDSNWILHPGEAFATPQLCCGYSNSGFERMTEILYDWQFDFLAPRPKAYLTRPIIFNSWYPYEFKIDENNLMLAIDKAAQVGAELFVIDDGWMPGRVNDKAGLGDWIPDPERFPNGLKPIADMCHGKNLLFGLWVEPEMANPDSKLYRQHPDWFIKHPTRTQTLSRSQLILDLSKDHVRDWAIQWLDQIIDDFELDYLKWDMNRYITEHGADKSLPIKYILNLYKIWEHLNQAHPNVIFENCASGGGRADFGMVQYADRINRSDNAHPADVMILHEGFSRLFIPKTAGGAGNVARDENVPLQFRIHLGMTGSMSLGIDLLKASQDTLDQLKKATDEFKIVRPALQDAYVYRIASATQTPYTIWQYVKRDRTEFGLFAFVNDLRHWDKLQMPRFKMRGLLPGKIYRDQDNDEYTGAELMNIGIKVDFPKNDYSSVFKFFSAN